MSNLADHVRQFGVNIGDTEVDERTAIGYLNRAVRELSRENRVLTAFFGTRSWSSSEHVQTYSLPVIHGEQDMTVRFDNEPLDGIKKLDLEKLWSGDRHVEGVPERWCVFDNMLELYPKPMEDADVTTLDKAISSAATSITLDSVDGFQSAGRAKIGSEVISWKNVDVDNCELQNVERALEGTIAAAHSEGALVTERNIEWWGALMPKKFINKPTISAQAAAATGSGVTNGEHHVYLTFYSSKWESESLELYLKKVTTSSQMISITNIPASDDDDVDYVRIYMTKAGGTLLFFVGQVAIGTESYDITTADGDLTSRFVRMVSNVPYKWRDVLDELAAAAWFMDHEQFERYAARQTTAGKILAEWRGSLKIKDGYEQLF
jgi:hypothetical protein